MPHPKAERRVVVVGKVKGRLDPEQLRAEGVRVVRQVDVGDDADAVLAEVRRFVAEQTARADARDGKVRAALVVAEPAGAPAARGGAGDAASVAWSVTKACPSCAAKAGRVTGPEADGRPWYECPRCLCIFAFNRDASGPLYDVQREGQTGLLPPVREEWNHSRKGSLPATGEGPSGSHAPHGRKQSGRLPNDTRTGGPCQLCAAHYGDGGPCDEGKPAASPHRFAVVNYCDVPGGLPPPPVPRTPPAGSEAALLLGIAANLDDRAELYVNPEHRRVLQAIAADLHQLTRHIGADPYGIGEGVRRG